MLDLAYNIAIEQSDLELAISRQLGLSYDEAEEFMCSIGCYQGNGPSWVDLDDEGGDTMKAVQAWMRKNNFTTIMVYEDH